MRWYRRFAVQALLAQVAVLLLVVGSGFALIAGLLRDELEQQYQQRALTVARAVAADRTIATYVAAGQANPDVRRRAEAVRVRTGALFISVADDRGTRYAHVDPGRVGKVGTVTADVLRGHELVAIEHGTLGASARGRVPLRDENGTVVGEVVAGIAADAIYSRLGGLLRAAAGFTVGTLVLGVAGAGLLTRQLKHQTLGLEPGDLADLLREREAVLHGVDEGVLAIDEHDRITLCNDAAAHLIGTAVAPGTPVHEAGLPPGLMDLSTRRSNIHGALTTAHDRILIVSSTPVRWGSRELGRVLTLLDHTELDQMARELDVVRALSDAVRAQAHEYTNRLHTLLGLLRLGHHDEAKSYVSEIVDDPIAAEHGSWSKLQDPFIRGVLAAKSAAASERGVQLRLSDETMLPARLTTPLDVVTVLGNLLDNAVAAAARGRRRPPWVEVSLVAQGDALDVIVVDSGDGVPEELKNEVFLLGTTSNPDQERPHGIGLTLARQMARKHGGNLELARNGGSDCGAVFVARLPGVLGPVRDKGSSSHWASHPFSDAALGDAP
jgi:two-component system CitB family sensor kinase